jgi:hypothetical protein
MDLHERQQFDFLLQIAVERFVERVQQLGEQRAQVRPFTDAIFADFLLDNADGACFVLRALSRETEATLIGMAKGAFSDLLQKKVEARWQPQ